ncbi:MAG: hypothetical protein E7583_03115 [Ruminococcaceae bacterium]|nr:hypothetical protein [Oscillospiraceae bacterium]
MKSNIVIFDKPDSAEKIAEGLAVRWAVISGICNMCKYLHQCENDDKFKFPKDALCMAKKSDFLKGANG